MWREVAALAIAARLRRLFAARAVRIALGGAPEAYGLPPADHKAVRDASDHQLANVVLRRSRKNPREADVQALDGDRIRFADGSSEPIDVLVYATGFRITIPFIDPVQS